MPYLDSSISTTKGGCLTSEKIGKILSPNFFKWAYSRLDAAKIAVRSGSVWFGFAKAGASGT
jgi:hypothetical protein